MLSNIEKIELELALNAMRVLIEQGAASRLSFEWKQDEHPTLTYTSTVPLEYISVEFTVQDEVKNG